MSRTARRARRGSSSGPTSSRPTPTSSRDPTSCGRGSIATASSSSPPSIDAFSPKNQDLDAETIDAILGAVGLTDDDADGRGDVRPPGRQPRAGRAGGRDPPGARRCPTTRSSSSRSRAGTASRTRSVCCAASPSSRRGRRPPPARRPRHDGRRRRPRGRRGARGGARGAGGALPRRASRARIHLACLPMDDVEENAAMVNALQRRADVVVQKSLAEGFGLTVAEAMWKARPVVASRVGGIQDQIDRRRQRPPARRSGRPRRVRRRRPPPARRRAVAGPNGQRRADRDRGELPRHPPPAPVPVGVAGPARAPRSGSRQVS